MSVWVWSGRAALIGGSVLFLVLFLPLVVWQYRRLGQLNLRRMLGAAAVSVYGTALVTYTWLPLPERSVQWCARHAVHGVNLVPFAWIDEVSAATAGLPWPQVLVHPSLLQVAFNIVLFVPWGLIVRRYLHRSVLAAVLSGLAGTLVVEATQATGLWGFYPCAYRFADIDDVIMNTLGALVGALIAPLLLWWMPNERWLSARRLEPRPVTSVRRWTGMVIDLALLVVLSTVLRVLYRVGLLLLGAPPSPLVDNVLSLLLPWVVVFLLPTRGWGASAGQAAVWLTPAWLKDGQPAPGAWWRRVLRASVALVVWALGPVVLTWWSQAKWALLWQPAVVLVSFWCVPWSATHRGLSGWLTGATMVDRRTLPEPERCA